MIKIGPVPAGIFNAPRDEPAGLEWFSILINAIKRSGVAVDDLDQTISATPTQAEVQAISDKVDELLVSLRNADLLDI